MKLRDPMTFAGAVHNVVLTIGYEHSANVVGRSVSLVTKWADPDNPSLPGFEQGVLLDAAYQETTCKPGPIIQAYMRQLDRLSDPLLGDPRVDVITELLDSIEELFALLADVRRHTKTRGANSLVAMNYYDRQGLKKRTLAASDALQNLAHAIDALPDPDGNITPIRRAGV